MAQVNLQMCLSLLKVILVEHEIQVPAFLFESCLQTTGNSFCIFLHWQGQGLWSLSNVKQGWRNELDFIHSPGRLSSKPSSQDWLWTVQKLLVISLPSNPVASLASVKQSHSLSSQPRVSFCYFCLPTNNCCDILTIIVTVSFCICQYIATKQSYMPFIFNQNYLLLLFNIC